MTLSHWSEATRLEVTELRPELLSLIACSTKRCSLWPSPSLAQPHLREDVTDTVHPHIMDRAQAPQDSPHLSARTHFRQSIPDSLLEINI